MTELQKKSSEIYGTDQLNSLVLAFLGSTLPYEQQCIYITSHYQKWQFNRSVVYENFNIINERNLVKYLLNVFK